MSPARVPPTRPNLLHGRSPRWGRLLALGFLALVFALAGCATGSGPDDDSAVRRAVRTAFLNDDTLRYRSDVDITVFRDDVLLTGTVPDREAGRRAAQLARDTDGAGTVFNELVVADAGSVFARTRDRVLLASARERLDAVARDQGFERERVRVVARRGRLYLLGRVTRAQAEALTEPLRRIRGVREVVRLFHYRNGDEQAGQAGSGPARAT